MAHKAEKTQPISLLSAPVRGRRLKKQVRSFLSVIGYAQTKGHMHMLPLLNVLLEEHTAIGALILGRKSCSLSRAWTLLLGISLEGA